MSYLNTFIKVSDDCPVHNSEIPVSKGDKKFAHVLQYELLTSNPYTYGHEELIYEVFVRHKQIPEATIITDAERIRMELFSKDHPCLRASALIKRYGFGAHYNDQGKIAIYPMESREYNMFLKNKSITCLAGMRSKR